MCRLLQHFKAATFPPLNLTPTNSSAKLLCLLNNILIASRKFSDLVPRGRSPPLMSKIVFCTVAYGQTYKNACLNLISDIKKHYPDASFCVLSDGAAWLADYPDVEIYDNPLRGVLYFYHSKRYIIEKAYRPNSTLIFLDANTRLYRSSEPTFDETLPAGISCRNDQWILRKLQDESPDAPSRLFKNHSNRRLKLVSRYAKGLQIPLSKCRFIHESAIVFSEVSPTQFSEFINTWDYLARRFTLSMLEWGEGVSIGMAAAKSEIPVVPKETINDHLFKYLFLPNEARFLNEFEELRQQQEEDQSTYVFQNQKNWRFSKLLKASLRYYRWWRNRKKSLHSLTRRLS